MRIKFSVILHPTEKKDLFLREIEEILGEGAEVRERRVKGFFSDLLYITAEASGKKAEKAMGLLAKKMTERSKEIVKKNIEGFIYEKGVLHMRFDKDLFVQGVLELSEGRRVVKMEANVEIFPRKKEKIVEEYIRVLGV